MLIAFKGNTEVIKEYGFLQAFMLRDVAYGFDKNGCCEISLSDWAQKYSLDKGQIRYAADKLKANGLVVLKSSQGEIGRYLLTGAGVKACSGEMKTFTGAIEIIRELGFLAAYIFHTIVYWYNNAKGNKQIDNKGYYDKSKKQMADDFLSSEKQIITAINKLHKKGYIEILKKGVKKADWYTLTEKGKDIKNKQKTEQKRVKNGKQTVQKMADNCAKNGKQTVQKMAANCAKNGNTYTNTLCNNPISTHNHYSTDNSGLEDKTYEGLPCGSNEVVNYFLTKTKGIPIALEVKEMLLSSWLGIYNNEIIRRAIDIAVEKKGVRLKFWETTLKNLSCGIDFAKIDKDKKEDNRDCEITQSHTYRENPWA